MSHFPLPADDLSLTFHQRKAQLAAVLGLGQDLSPKGSIDQPIIQLINYINTLPSYCTTSSCSGRISIFQHRSVSVTKGGCWLLINHSTATWEEFQTAVGKIQKKKKEEHATNDQTSSSTTTSSATPVWLLPSTGDVVLRFEPFILAIECETLQAANAILQIGMQAGFRESGVSGLTRRYIVSIRSSVRLEVPIYSASANNGEGRLLVDESYMRYLLELANEKYEKNIAKIERFFEAVRKASHLKTIGSIGTSMNGDINQRDNFTIHNDNQPINNISQSTVHPSKAHVAASGDKKKSKYYNPFETSSSLSVGVAKSKLSPHALLHRQERVLHNFEILERRLEKIEDNLRRVQRGEPIVKEEMNSEDKKTQSKKSTPSASTSSAPKPSSIDIKHSKVKPKQTNGPAPTNVSVAAALAKAIGAPIVSSSAPLSSSSMTKPSDSSASSSPSPSIAVSSTSTSSSASTSTAVLALFVPRSQTKIVKDACSARRWLDVRYKIEPVDLPEEIRSNTDASSSSTKWMRLVIDSEGTRAIQDALRHARKSYVQQDLLHKLLDIPHDVDIAILHAMIQLEPQHSNPSTRPLKGAAPGDISATTSPSAPPRVKLVNALKSRAQEFGLDPSAIEKLVPTKWEKLGDDLIIFPAGSWSNIPSHLKHSTAPSVISPFWLTVLASFHGLRRICVSHEVALADVLRTSQVEIVVTGEESNHPIAVNVSELKPDQRGGWVTHRENGITYQFDCTKVMFSSGNGTEKARIVASVQNENIAERHGDEDGETIVDLYAGIGYFTLPLLVHTAVNTNTPKDSKSSSSLQGAGAPRSKLRFLHACELNPSSLDSLARNIRLNHIAPSRVAIHPGDNRRPELVEQLRSTADRISLGLLPSAEDAYASALKILRTRGGLLHVHANVPDHGREEFVNALAARLRHHLDTDEELRSSDKHSWLVKVFRLTCVKPYAPHVDHVVADVACFPKESIWWTKQAESEHAATTASLPAAKSATTVSASSARKTVAFDATALPANDATSFDRPSADPSTWFPYPHDLPVVTSPTYTQFREIVAGQVPCVLRNVDLGPDWREAFSPDNMLAMSASKSSQANPLVSVHVSPHSTRMDFLKRNYMFKQMKLNEMLQRMKHIGRDRPDGSSIVHTDSSSTARSPEVLNSSSSTQSITRDSYFISPHELYYLRALGSNPKTEVANFWHSFPELAKKIRMPRAAITPTSSTATSASTNEPSYLLQSDRVFSSIFRVSSPGLQLWTHYDIADNLLLHLHGLKRVVIFPPTCADGIGLKSTPDSSSSPILDVDSTQPSGAPSIQAWQQAQTLGRQVILLPGDILFLPALWFHNVTSLNTHYVDGYAKVMNSHSNGSSSSSLVSSSSIRSAGDICVSLNIFWKELPDEEYQSKDLYGNKDLVKSDNYKDTERPNEANIQQ